MMILIPTHGRFGRQFTLREIPKEWLDRTVLVTTHDQYRDHRILYGKDVALWRAPATVKTIAQKRAWMMERARTEGIDKVLMLDDDLRFSRREFEDRADGTWTFKLRKATPADVAWGLRKVERMLDKFCHVGIGARQGNNGILRYRRWNPNFRMMYALGYRVDTVLKKAEFGRIEHREDMDVCLQLLTKGYANRVLVELVCDQVYNSAGGAHDERKIERSNADAGKLARWFPDFVKEVQREYKQSVPRREVVVAWKKAYEYGAERRHARVRRT